MGLTAGDTIIRLCSHTLLQGVSRTQSPQSHQPSSPRDRGDRPTVCRNAFSDDESEAEPAPLVCENAPSARDHAVPVAGGML